MSETQTLATPDQQTQPEQPNNRRRKVQAGVAVASVLGLGAIATLAAWQGDQFAEGWFGTGSFEIESSPTSATDGYQNHGEDDDGNTNNAELTFEADAMVPGDVVYAPLWIRAADGSSLPGIISDYEVERADGDNVDNLTVALHSIDSSDTCGAGAIDDDNLSAEGTNLGTISNPSSPIEVPVGDGGPGAPVQLCFAVTAGEDLVPTGSDQEDATTATWEITVAMDDSDDDDNGDNGDGGNGGGGGGGN
ncbi:hypothetical protein [Nesterenkonia alba]|uniref:hypothetical protein n=1 Tax=Nesterenkonia alba TaxID=515814 RepID=UPI0003B3201B|nr:hypothetical protein [Nesterenkonia alba]